MIKVIVNGCNGKIGKEIVQAVKLDGELELVGQTGTKDNLAEIIRNGNADAVIDFTNPQVAYKNAETIIANHCNAIIGTTGITPEQRASLGSMAMENKVGILIAPNFCIGAILMMKFAAEAAKYMPNVEIIEYHHDQKADSPSGTAISTAEYINSKVAKTNPPSVVSQEMLNENSQGAKIGNIRIHAVRLPGFVASQEVIFGENGHTLKIRHDAINRESYLPGILQSTKKIIGKIGLFYGLETLIFQE
jgi:4-hydroxy-tetrahydrodipicolinate reductase